VEPGGGGPAARARGLTAEEIERESDDDDSQYWVDVWDAAQEYRRRHPEKYGGA
jgi:hypothetical protein